MSLAAIVPVWNGRDLLARLLDTLEAQTLRADDLIVIDNGSADGAPDLARARRARVIPMGRNAGFAAAVNRGLEEAAADYVAILNSDVELAPDYFATLIAALKETNLWFATGKILSITNPQRLDATFDLTSRGAATWRAGSARADSPMFAPRREIYSAPLTAALFRATTFDELKKPARAGSFPGPAAPAPAPFCVAFESYLEDVDLGLRLAARRLAGVYVPTATARHHGSASLGHWHADTVRRIARNQIFLVARHYPAPARYLWPIFVAQTLWGLVALRHGAALAWMRGVSQGLRQFSSVRRTSEKTDQNVLDSFLRANERSLREIQSATGFDIYWKLYFLLTRGGTK